ncbi:DUF2690 domain-containing protein [Streptomyces endophytica]|uniref:YjfA family protein n=1 Tax=Streptomyces endophytica TaxID=2991496 RepID=A0ABY6P6B5_9ACTN|nr:DUF2690 domain-containing protein [Streptomyces endophytica]UZJ29334.1 YjfA family protein [Streptomyces endophytica]
MPGSRGDAEDPHGGTDDSGAGTRTATPDARSWLKRHGPETLIGSVIVAAVTTVLTVTIPLLAGGDPDDDRGGGAGPVRTPSAVTAATEPPTCTMIDCDGLDPKDTHCDRGAVTLAREMAGSMQVSVRYSPGCRTVWGKLTGAEEGDTIEIATSPAKKERKAVHTGHTQYTAMLPAGRTFSAQATGTSLKGQPAHDLPPGHQVPVGAGQNDIPPL